MPVWIKFAGKPGGFDEAVAAAGVKAGSYAPVYGQANDIRRVRFYRVSEEIADSITRADDQVAEESKYIVPANILVAGATLADDNYYIAVGDLAGE